MRRVRAWSVQVTIYLLVEKRRRACFCDLYCVLNMASLSIPNSNECRSFGGKVIEDDSEIDINFRAISIKLCHLNNVDTPLIYYLYPFSKYFLEYHDMLGELDPIVKNCYQPILPEEKVAAAGYAMVLLKKRHDLFLNCLDCAVFYDPTQFDRVRRNLNENKSLANLHEAMSVLDTCCNPYRHYLIVHVYSRLQQIGQEYILSHENFNRTFFHLKCTTTDSHDAIYWTSLYTWKVFDLDERLRNWSRLADKDNLATIIRSIVLIMLKKTKQYYSNDNINYFIEFCAHYLSQNDILKTTTRRTVIYFLGCVLRRQELFLFGNIETDFIKNGMKKIIILLYNVYYRLRLVLIQKYGTNSHECGRADNYIGQLVEVLRSILNPNGEWIWVGCHYHNQAILHLIKPNQHLIQEVIKDFDII